MIHIDKKVIIIIQADLCFSTARSMKAFWYTTAPLRVSGKFRLRRP